MNLICESLVDRCLFFIAFALQAETSRFTSEICAIRRFRHCPDNTRNSISARLSQLPCFGFFRCWRIHFDPAMFFLFPAHMSRTASGTHKCRGLFMTYVIFLSACGYFLTISAKKNLPVLLFRVSVTFNRRLPINSSVSMKIVQVTFRTYSTHCFVSTESPTRPLSTA